MLADTFRATFATLVAPGADVELLPSAALELVALPEIRGLFVPPKTFVDVVSQGPIDDATRRLAAALWVGFALLYEGRLDRRESGPLAMLADAAHRACSPHQAIEPIYVALSVYRYVTVGDRVTFAGSRGRSYFTDRSDQRRILELALCCEVAPDRETFSDGWAAEMLFDLDDDEVRDALGRIWPGSTAWDDYLRECREQGNPAAR